MKKIEKAKSADTGQSNRQVLTLAAIILVALILRLYRLGTESFWIDEGFSLRDATKFSFLGETRPLYFLFLSAWMKLGMGKSEFLLRLPSALFGTAGVWVFYAVGRRLIGTSAALLAAAFMAISVLQVNHSREVRMYSLTVLLALVATHLLILALEREKTGYVLGYAAVSLLGLLTYPLMLFVIAAHGVFLLLYVKAYRPMSLALIGSQLAIFGGWIKWLFNNMSAAAGYSEGYTSIIEKPTLTGVVTIMGKFFLWKWAGPSKGQLILATLFSLMVVGLALYGLKGFRRADARLAFVLIWLAVPMAATIAFSHAVSNVWMPHYMIAVSPALFLLVARGIFSVRRRYVAVAAVFLIGAMTLGRLWLYFSRHARPEWRPAVAYIQAHERPGDVIGVYYAGNQYVFRWYYRGHARWSPLGRDEIDRRHFTGWNDERVAQLLGDFPDSGQRFWLALSNHNYAGGAEIVNYVYRHYRVLDHKYYSQIELLLLDKGGANVPE